MMLQAEAVHTALGDEGDIHPRSSFPPRAVTQVRRRSPSLPRSYTASASLRLRKPNALDAAPPSLVHPGKKVLPVHMHHVACN